MEEERPLTLSVPDAGRIYFGMGRNASYAAAEKGELPVVRIGRRRRVPIRALERMLDQAGARIAEPAADVDSRVVRPGVR
jgi:hypothetical protein